MSQPGASSLPNCDRVDDLTDLPPLLSDYDSSDDDYEVLPARQPPPPLPRQVATTLDPYSDMPDLISDPDSDSDDEPASRRLAAVHIYPFQI